ncbi:MAG: NUDIX domain-containing protein [Nanoarchaeota archaeon]
MRTAISAAVISHGQILIVRKRKTFILPGGKPEKEEPDEKCLRREFAEELSGTLIKDLVLYREFEGTAPHERDLLKCRVYFASLDGALMGVSSFDSVDDYAWANRAEIKSYNLSDITGKVVDSLIKDEYL